MNNTKYNINISHLIAKSVEGNISDEEKFILTDWLDASESNKLLYVRLISDLSVKIKQNIDISSKKKIWQNINIDIKRKKRLALYRNIQIAACVLIIFSAASFFIIAKPFYKPSSIINNNLIAENLQPVLINSEGESIVLDSGASISEYSADVVNDKKGELVYKPKKDNSLKKEKYNTIIIPRGGRYKLRLADGSKVWLNSNSKFKYPINFIGKERHVYLDGEAFFDVSKDKSKAFVVSVKDAMIKVYGTSFNVHAYDYNSAMTTTLLEGLVKLTQGEIEKFIKPNQQISIDTKSGDYIVANVDTRIYTSWMENKLSFHRQNLSQIMSSLSNYYDIEFYYTSDNLKNIKFSGQIELYDNIQDVFNILETTKKIKFKKEKNIIIIDKY